MSACSCWAIVCLLSLAAGPSPGLLCEPWGSAYADQDATGEHVIACWSFDGESGTDDDSGGGHGLSLQDARIHHGGRFGRCLESFPGWPVEDKRHRALAPDHPALSPSGALSIEMWICPKEEFGGEYPEAFLLDKKYVADDDYQLILSGPNRDGSRVVRACLGFGDSSATWYARPAMFPPGQWQHLAFTYDGAGTGSFFLNGVPWGRSRQGGCEHISPGRHPLSIGDRIGSYYHGFPGYIDQVRICRGPRCFERVGFERASDRGCFVRMEPDASLLFRVTNLQRAALDAAQLTFTLDGRTVRETSLAQLDPGRAMEVPCPIDTRLRPDAYRLTARLTAPGPPTIETEDTFEVQIVPRELPRLFPVVMWGVYGGLENEIERLKEIGFTHALGPSADYRKIWEVGAVTEPGDPEQVARTKQMLDTALAHGLHVAAALSPGAAMRGEQRFQRVDRAGARHASRPDICGLFPEFEPFCRHVGGSVAQAYGHFPALDAALLHTEVRDHARPCFHEHDRAAFRRQAGIDIPAEVVGPRGVNYSRLSDFPANRVIPDDHPLYTYYRWYWKTGDGWNGLNTALHQGLHSTGRDDLWTWHDPAVRVASVYGSGGEADVLSQWTYSYPDPIRIAVATDELLAMAAGAPQPQRVMKMTQVIWYRSQTAPPPKAAEDPPAPQARWEGEQPDAPFITIAPMHLREAFWTKIARPIDGIMYHGWQSLVPCHGPSSYRYTHPQTRHELARLIRQVITPLGPTLRAVPGVRSDVAFLNSFASEMFAGRGTFGWSGGWGGDAYLVALYAHLQPEVVFDETIAQRGLDGFRVLWLTDCDVLTETVAKRIGEFQQAGGLVVGDERLCPAIEPDIRLASYRRTGKADRDQAALLALAAQLRDQLDAHYNRYVNTSAPEVIPYRRRFGDTDYVFLVNDRREYGQYVGQHGIVMEHGLPSQAVVSVGRPQGFVYDLIEHRQVPATVGDGQLQFEAALGPCDGGIFMISPQAIDRVSIDAPQRVDLAADACCRIEVVDGAGARVDAVVPLEVNVRDPEGRAAEFSGCYAAESGAIEIDLQIAPNDRVGVWQVDVRELASGRRATHAMRVGNEPPAIRGATEPPDGIANPVQPRG